MNIKLETITVERAQMLLATNEEGGDFKNRSSSNVKVETIANDIRNGNWKQTHQPVALFWDKVKRHYVLVDGRHRCKAIVVSGMDVDTLVAYYPNRAAAMDAISAVDLGKPRKAGDISAMTNATKDYHTARNGAARLLARLETGKVASTIDIVEVAHQTQDLFDLVHHHEWSAPVTVTGAFMFAYKQFGGEVATLAEKIAKGVNLSRQEAVLQRIVFAQHGRGGIDQITNAIKIVRAIEACVKGQNVSKFRRCTRSEYVDRLSK